MASLLVAIHTPIMNDPFSIINTPVLPQSIDAFWLDSENIGLLPQSSTLFVSYPFTSDAEEQILQNLLRACQLGADQYVVAQLPLDHTVAWHKLKAQVNPSYVVFLGVEPSSLLIHIMMMPHQVNRFDGCAVIPTLSLSGLEEQPLIKTHCWQYGLKPVFVDKSYG